MSALYLILPGDFSPARHMAALEACLATGAVEAALLWLAAGDDAAWTAAADAALPVLHGAGVPLLIGDADRAAQIKCDGVHIEADASEIKRAASARAPRLTVGAGGVFTRHNAMLAGEAGADYVLFGSLNPARGDMGEAETIRDLAAWWSEVFEVPCAAAAATPGEAEALAQAGAEFIAVRDFIWNAGGAEIDRVLARLAGAAVA